MVPAHDFSGRTLEGRYALVRRLGAGGFASVYLARDMRVYGRKVAVKVMHPEQGADPVNVERFVQEMKVAARLDGPYRDRVVKVIDHGRCEAGAPLLYLVMEFVDGVTLQKLLTTMENGEKRRRPMPWMQSASLIQELAKALATLHAAGVVHRDIKPGNCIIQQHPDGDYIKLLDLGIVKVLPGHEISDIGPQTHPDLVIGTPRYMAPEQRVGSAHDPRIDLYAAGVMLYEFLTGDVPARWIGLPGAADPLRPIAPSQANPGAGIPATLDAVALRAVAFKPEDRFQTAQELATALAEIVIAAERELARARALAEVGPRVSWTTGVRAAFAVGEPDARGWTLLRWWVTVATTCVAMSFVVAFAATLRRGHGDGAAFLDEEAQQAAMARARAENARAKAKRTTTPVAAPVRAPAEPPPPAPVEAPRPAPARPKVRPPAEPPEAWPVSVAGVEAAAERAFTRRCKGVKGTAKAVVRLDTATARFTGVEVEGDPKLQACISKHAAAAFQFAGLSASRRVAQYTFMIDVGSP